MKPLTRRQGRLSGINLVTVTRYTGFRAVRAPWNEASWKGVRSLFSMGKNRKTGDAHRSFRAGVGKHHAGPWEAGERLLTAF